MKKALAEVGPMVVGVKADTHTFYGYSEGIYDDLECYGGVNHAVCLVGEDVFCFWDNVQGSDGLGISLSF